MRPTRIDLVRAAAATCAVLVATTATADVPDVDRSVLPDCIGVAPSGGIITSGTLRNADGDPCAGAEVTLIFDDDACSLYRCADEPTVLTTTSTASGNFALFPQMGGCCAGEGVARLEVDGVVLVTFDNISSPDHDGDGDVDLVDFTRFQEAWYTENRCFRYRFCSGLVDIVDYTMFQAEFSLGCE